MTDRIIDTDIHANDDSVTWAAIDGETYGVTDGRVSGVQSLLDSEGRPVARIVNGSLVEPETGSLHQVYRTIQTLLAA
jgi:hypothetical protein